MLKSCVSEAVVPDSSAVKALQKSYAKMLLPYECHLKSLSFPDCLAKLESYAMMGVGVGVGGTSKKLTSPLEELQGSSGGKDGRENHIGGCDQPEEEEDEGALDSLMEEEDKVNGNNESLSMREERFSHRTNSQDSDVSGFHPGSDGKESALLDENSQSSSIQGSQQQLTPTVLEPSAPQKQDSLPFPDNSQNSVDNLSQAEPLPDISVQEAESLLGMSSSPYPPPYSYQNQREWGGSGTAGSGADFVPPPNMDAPDIGMMPLSAPPSYPPSYGMDMAGPYRPPSVPHGYPPYGPSPPSQSDFPAEYQHGMQSAMIRGAYPSSNPYQMVSSPMHMVRSMDSGQFGMYPHHHRSPMMPPQHQHHHHLSMMRQRGVEGPEMAYHVLPGMSPEWHWQQQQQQHQQQQQQQRARMLSSIPMHLQPPPPPSTHTPHHHHHHRHMHPQQQQQQHPQYSHSHLPYHPPPPSSSSSSLSPSASASASASSPRLSSAVLLPSSPLGGPPHHQQQHRASPHQIHLESAPPHSKGSSSSSSSSASPWQQQQHDHAHIVKSSSGKPIGASSSSSPKLGIHHHHHVSLQKQHHQDLKMMMGSGSSSGKSDSHHPDVAGAKRSHHPDWTHCVEGTKPQLVKRRRLFSGDCGELEVRAVYL